ncbi:MAG: O-Antigen ligase [Chloroflexota bacterium]|nr:O-Antigen ligase [Chloroflexota bacterium]
MQTSEGGIEPSVTRARSRAIGLGGIAAIGAFTYMVLLGGTHASEVNTLLAAISGLVAAPMIAFYIWRIELADRLDRLVLTAIILFIVSCALSLLPRQSFEPALAAIAFGAALFVARGVLARVAAARALVWAILGLSAGITVLTAARWGVYLVEWMSLADWRTIPALNMELPSIPWGHRHDLALLIVMLYPAWWVGRPSRPRRFAAVIVGAVVAALVVIDGSRMLWFAIVAAAAASAAVAMRRRPGVVFSSARRVGLAALLLIGIAGVALLASGVGGSLLDRLTNFESVGWRTAMWQALVDWWLAHPLAGGGPGSFPWLLQGTAYFDTSSFAPRHPDSAPIQLLAEAGLLGMAALVVLLAAIVPALVRARAAAPAFALVAFATASLGSNPTDFAFMVIVAIAWVAYALPRPSAAATSAGSAGSRARRASLVLRSSVAVGAIGVAAVWGMTLGAAAAYEDARHDISRGDTNASIEALDRAEALDPGMGLYPRQSATLQLSLGRPGAALPELQHALRLNPLDDLAWRTLALAHDAIADDAEADAAIRQALDRQRSDPANLLLAALWEADRGSLSLAQDLVAETIQAWPEVIYSATWDSYMSATGLETEALVANAADRWISGRPQPELTADQGLWLTVIAGREESVDRALKESGHSSTVGSAAVSLLRCEAATEILDGASPADLRNVTYWLLRIRDASLTGVDASQVRDMAELMRRRRIGDHSESMNPLDENSPRGLSSDQRGYRRSAIAWDSYPPALPSPLDGMAQWLRGSDCDR